MTDPPVACWFDRRRHIKGITRVLVRRRTFILLLIPVFLVIVAKPNWTFYGIGISLALLGQCVRIWASGYIHKTEKLAVGGPFAFVRNPLYVGTLMMGLGYCIATNRWWCYPIGLLLYLGVHWPTIHEEERVLAAKFGEDYERYCATVPRLFTRLRPYPEATGKFVWAQVWENCEYRSIVGFVLAAILFAVRIWY